MQTKTVESLLRNMSYIAVFITGFLMLQYGSLGVLHELSQVRVGGTLLLSYVHEHGHSWKELRRRACPLQGVRLQGGKSQ